MEFINTIINGFHYLSQTWGQDFDIVVTVATLIVSFIAWIKTKTLVFIRENVYRILRKKTE